VSNALVILNPYWNMGTWVFDDPAVGLSREAFVAGADTIISHMVREQTIPNATRGFVMVASADAFPGHQYTLTWQEGDGHGNWYQLDGTDMRGWLCPALFHYFDPAPEKLFVQVREQGEAA
jgi:hypothetical protein